MSLLGIDLGTTRCKAGLFDESGSLLSLSATRTPVHEDGQFPYHDPEELWIGVRRILSDVLSREPATAVRGIGVAGMAEAGLLLDSGTGRPRTHIIPWYDARAEAQVGQVLRVRDTRSLFRTTGLHPSFKYGLPKLLWLRERDPSVLDGAVWLSVPDYIVFRLCGELATDPSLAARTFAFDIESMSWDGDLLETLGLSPSLFPPILPAGSPAGSTTVESGVAAGIPVAVCGHDHLCAAFGLGVDSPEVVLDSMGTAESLVGTLPQGRLPESAFETGLVVCPSVQPGTYCWLAGLRASGGSVEWLRSLLAEPPLDYDDLRELVRSVPEQPTGILYFPYLHGQGGASHLRGAGATYSGVMAAHGRAHLARAVLEGTAFEIERLRRAAEELGGPMRQIVAVGGGSRITEWVQIKADVSGCEYVISGQSEATAAGAARAVGMYVGVERWEPAMDGTPVQPDPNRAAAYRTIYECDYARLREAVYGGHKRVEAMVR